MRLHDSLELRALPGVAPRGDVGHHQPCPEVLHLVGAQGDEGLGVPVHGEADLLVEPVEEEDDPGLPSQGPGPDLPGVGEETAGVGGGEAASALVGAAVLHTPRLNPQTVLVDVYQPLVGDDLVGLALPGDVPQVRAQHQGRLDDAPEREHRPVLGVRHPALPHEQTVRIVPAAVRALHTGPVVPLLVIDVDVPQQLLPGVLTCYIKVKSLSLPSIPTPHLHIHRGPPEVAEAGPEGLHVTESPGAELECDVSNILHSSNLRGLRIVRSYSLFNTQRTGCYMAMTIEYFSQDYPVKKGLLEIK